MTRLLAVYDGANNLIMRFQYADGRMPVAMTKEGVTYYLTYDQIGSLRAVADSAGNVVKRIDYDSFGNIINDTNQTFIVPFGFAGGLHDRDTGLVRFGFRDYDPDIGRWTAKDPIRFAAGDTDLYGYVLNDPVNLIDPEGSLAFGPLLYFAAAKLTAVSVAYFGTKSAMNIGNKANKITKACVADTEQQNKDINQAFRAIATINAAEIGVAGIVNLSVVAGPYLSTSAIATNPEVIKNTADFAQGFALQGPAPPSTGGYLGATTRLIMDEVSASPY